MPTALTLQIAGLRVMLDCHHRKLAAVLRERYRDFLAAGAAQSALRADVYWTGSARGNALLETSPRFEGGVLHFAAAGYAGMVDAVAGRGELMLSSRQPVEEIDYFLRAVYALLAHEAGGVLLHAAGLAREGDACLFLGPSGSGKTTLCRLSQSRATILNDDLVLLIPRGERWQVYGTPFWNPTQVRPAPQSAPLRAMFRLVQSKRVFTRPLGAGAALAVLSASAPVVTDDPARLPRLLETLAAVQSAAPMRELHFLPDTSFWEVICDWQPRGFAPGDVG